MSNQTRTGLLALAIVGGLFVLVAIVVAVLIIVPQSRGTAGGSGSGSGGGLFGTSKPRADREGEQCPPPGLEMKRGPPSSAPPPVNSRAPVGGPHGLSVPPPDRGRRLEL